MSVRFDAQLDFYSATTGLPASTTWTVTFWVYLVTDRNVNQELFGYTDSITTEYVYLYTDVDGTSLRLWDHWNHGGGNLINALPLTVGAWHKVAISAAGLNATWYYAPDGSALSSQAISDLHSPTTPGTITIGGDGGDWMDCRVAAFKMWQAALTQTEIEAELAQFAPVRTTNLLRYHPFRVAEVTDYSGNGNSLTANGTITAEADPSIPDVALLQPTYVADRGAAADATAATTTTVTLSSPTSITVGNYLIARVAVDNSGTNGAAPGCTVTDPRSNTWTVLGPALVDPGVAAAGATAYLAYTKVGTAYQAADALTFNWGGISTTAKAIVVEEWAKIAGVAPVAVSAVTATGTASTTVTVSITPTAAYQLVYTCLASEGIAADTFTGDADTTNGTWTTLTTTASANATATNNQRVMGQYKVVTTGGAQSWDATITNRDWAALAVVFSPPQIQPRPTVANQAALVRAGSW